LSLLSTPAIKIAQVPCIISESTSFNEESLIGDKRIELTGKIRRAEDIMLWPDVRIRDAMRWHRVGEIWTRITKCMIHVATVETLPVQLFAHAVLLLHSASDIRIRFVLGFLLNLVDDLLHELASRSILRNKKYEISGVKIRLRHGRFYTPLPRDSTTYAYSAHFFSLFQPCINSFFTIYKRKFYVCFKQFNNLYERRKLDLLVVLSYAHFLYYS
jgi:hypothetical protein